ncbi:unnamed protein product (macronuclear) [Paramecium tetraurelia]|uniref:Anaphase-promoting complex subunit 4 WD40 domain-containing protein n=1 Tax=Paramecium tetraurelia TaxID=5888 RepID=A0CJM1_PARTE|nr:uncharacterized protein GSPATT00000700001 [Paramecium tetraurelia]CAK70988.1 unnamed protein product [Paramecium tetraurelia]|eukprot:XP_001438385.1 hypothetical protein (macronuclear) [Paramecium tetraurelia strain d4-2]
MNQHNLKATLAIPNSGFDYCLSQDEKLFYIVSADLLMTYEISTGKKNIIAKLDEMNLSHPKICVSSDNSICCVSAQAIIKGQVTFVLLKFDLEKKLLSETYINYHLMQVEMLEFLQNSQMLISLSIDTTIKIFDFAHQKPKTILTRCKYRALYCKLMQNQNRLIIIDNLSKVQLLDVNTEKLIKSFQLRSGNFRKAILEKNGIMALIAKSQKCFLYNLPKQKLIRKYEISDDFKQLIFLTDHLILQDDGLIILVNIATCKQKQIHLKNTQDLNNLILYQNLNKLIICDKEQIYFLDIIYLQEQ